MKEFANGIQVYRRILVDTKMMLRQEVQLDITHHSCLIEHTMHVKLTVINDKSSEISKGDPISQNVNEQISRLRPQLFYAWIKLERPRYKVRQGSFLTEQTDYIWYVSTASAEVKRHRESSGTKLETEFVTASHDSNYTCINLQTLE